MFRLVLFLLIGITANSFSQAAKLAIIKHTDKDFVIPKYTKLVYRGLSNELFINVPKATSFEVEGIGVTKVSKNIYSVIPSSGKELIITISGVINNKKFLEQHSFEIRNINRPVTYFNYFRGDSIIRVSKNKFENALITIAYDDKNFNLNFVIRKFSLKIPGQKTIEVKGNKIDAKTFALINSKATKHDQILICDICVSASIPLVCFIPSPMIIEII